MAKISKGWVDTFADLPSGKVAADALVGGGLASGANYASNSSSGETGGYLKAGLAGAALGGVTRGVLAKSRNSAAVAAETTRTAARNAEAASPEAGPGLLASMAGYAVGAKNKAVSVYGNTTASASAAVRDFGDTVMSPLRNQRDQIRQAGGLAENIQAATSSSIPKALDFEPVMEVAPRMRGTLDQLTDSRANPTPVSSFLQGADYSKVNTRVPIPQATSKPMLNSMGSGQQNTGSMIQDILDRNNSLPRSYMNGNL